MGLVRLDTIEIHGFANRLTQRMFLHRRAAPLHRRDGRHLPALKPAGATDYLAVVREFIGAYSQRGLVIVISDFLDDNGCERALQYLADFGHELMLLQIWADEDRTPPWMGELELRDAETGAAHEAGFRRRARERYTRAFDEYCAIAFRHWRCAAAAATPGVSTSQPLEERDLRRLIRVRGSHDGRVGG